MMLGSSTTTLSLWIISVLAVPKSIAISWVKKSKSAIRLPCQVNVNYKIRHEITEIIGGFYNKISSITEMWDGSLGVSKIR
jgi:hypothetical protein